MFKFVRLNIIFLQGKRIKINFSRKIAERFQFFQYFWLLTYKRGKYEL